MHFQTHLREAMSNLLSAKMRSVLAVLGVLVGTASVVALISGGQLATEHALEQFKKLGTDTFAVSIQSNIGGQDSSKARLSPQEQISSVMGLVDQIPAVTKLAPYSMAMDNISYDGNTINAYTLGITAELQQILKLTTLDGRFISPLDTTEYYCVVGQEVVSDLKSAGALQIIGTQLLIGSHYYSIVGVLNSSAENLFVFVNLNKTVLIPLAAELETNPKSTINNIIFKVRDESYIDKVNAPVTSALNDIYPGARLFFRSPQEIIKSMKDQSKTFNLLLGFIGSIALVVGGIGVMNIMLVSVVERRREIGIRLAIGAKRRDIQYMFLTESVALTLFGGLLGVVLGEVIAFTTSTVSGWTFHLYPIPPIIGFLVSAMTGIFFGFYPAKKAAMLDPIESLRSD